MPRDGLIDDAVILLGDGRIFVALPRIAGGKPRKFGALSSRSQCKMEVPKKAIGGRFEPGPRSIGRRPQKIIAYDDVASDFLQLLFQAIVLSGNVVDEQTIEITRNYPGPGGVSFSSGDFEKGSTTS
jgi:hypothetical protein